MFSPSLPRRLMPTLLAAALAPLALQASAFSGPAGDTSSAHPSMQRAALYERAGIDAATREALAEAHDAHRQALRELHAQHRERLDEILGEEQRAALQTARRELRDERRAAHQAARQQRLTELVDRWGLSDTERARLTEMRHAFYADLQALRDQTFDSREARRDAWRALREEHRAALGELLNEDQLAELSALRRQPDARHRPAGHTTRRHAERSADCRD